MKGGTYKNKKNKKKKPSWRQGLIKNKKIKRLLEGRALFAEIKETTWYSWVEDGRVRLEALPTSILTSSCVAFTYTALVVKANRSPRPSLLSSLGFVDPASQLLSMLLQNDSLLRVFQKCWSFRYGGGGRG